MSTPMYLTLSSGDADDAAEQQIVDGIVVGGDFSDGRLLTGSAITVINATTFADLTAATTAYNTLLAALRTRGIITGS